MRAVSLNTRTNISDPYTRRLWIGIGIAPLTLALMTSTLGNFGLMNRPFGEGGFILIAVTAVLPLWFSFMANQRVVLYENAIEKTTWFSTRRLDRENILGWRGKSYRGHTYVFVPRDNSRGLSLLPIFRRDQTFFEWKKSVPHLKN
jgi:hypothetical protein